MTSARAQLLAAVVDDVAVHGIADRSLREIADSVGTSHRMLLYHFGSRAGLVRAIVDAVEANQRSLLVGGAPAGGAADVMRASWRRVSDPSLRPFVQLFFEAVAAASRDGGAAFTSIWLDDAARAGRALGLEPDPVGARLAIAVMRGLLIDVVNDDDPAAADAAFERFLAVLGGAAERPATANVRSQRRAAAVRS